VEHIIKLARKGLTPSQIGVTLRDSHGIPQVRFVTGNKILRVLKSNGASASSPHIVADRSCGSDGSRDTQALHLPSLRTSGI
jgi:hypothetical protein